MTTVPAVGGEPDRTAITLPEELQVACSIGASFQASIQHADNKVSMLGVLACGIVTLMLSQGADLRGAFVAGGGLAAALVIALSVFVTALAYTGASLARAVRPRITPPSSTNRFAFPAVAVNGESALRGASIEELCTDAWALNKLLAAIATEKHRHVQRAVTGTAALASAAVVCLIFAVIAA